MPPKQRTPAAKAPAATPAATSKASSTPTTPRVVPSLPLAHYLSRTPLHLAAIIFCLYTSSDKSLKLSVPSTILTSLVNKPVPTLLTTCVSLPLVQAWYGSWFRNLLLLAASTDGTQKKGGEVATPKEKKTKKPLKAVLGEIWSKGLSGQAVAPVRAAGVPAPTGWTHFDHLFPASLTVLGGAVALHACAVLLGAPLHTKISETFLLSLLVSLLAFAPVAIAFPITDRYAWLRLFSSVAPANDVELALLVPAIGTLVGCWLGAVPIPLDWDRPWQTWPTTCAIGAIGGHAIGQIVSVILCSRRAAQAEKAKSS